MTNSSSLFKLTANIFLLAVSLFLSCSEPNDTAKPNNPPDQDTLNKHPWRVTIIDTSSNVSYKKRVVVYDKEMRVIKVELYKKMTPTVDSAVFYYDSAKAIITTYSNEEITGHEYIMLNEKGQHEGSSQGDPVFEYSEEGYMTIYHVSPTSHVYLTWENGNMMVAKEDSFMDSRMEYYSDMVDHSRFMYGFSVNYVTPPLSNFYFMAPLFGKSSKNLLKSIVDYSESFLTDVSFSYQLDERGNPVFFTCTDHISGKVTGYTVINEYR